MVKDIKNGRLMITKSTTINSTLELGLRVRWKARANYCLLKAKFILAIFKMATLMVLEQGSGQMETFTKDSS